MIASPARDAGSELRRLYNQARMHNDVKLMTQIASAIHDLHSGEKDAALALLQTLLEQA